MRPADFISITERTAPPARIFIRHADSPFGQVFLAADEIGVTNISLNEDARALSDMRKAMPKTDFVEHSVPHHEAALSYFTDRPQSLSLHLKGTPFQLAVWRALLDIPFGRASSYKTIAEQIGKPKANRAVGSAVGKNPVFFVIPCHRVLAHDGSLGGYFYGLEKKQDILNFEMTRR